MAEDIKRLRIFIACPSDCQKEKDEIRRIVREDESILSLCRKLKVSADVFAFDDLPPDTGRPQSIINAAIAAYNPDGFIFIFKNRLGSDAGFGMTGAEEEWNLARQSSEQGRGRPWASLYFDESEFSAYEVDEDQRQALDRFKQSIFKEHDALACRFSGFTEFQNKFRSHLVKRLLDVAPLSSTINLDEQLEAASQSLLQWPRTLKDGSQIDRPELAQLLEKISNSNFSTTLVLGSPGSGKSALLSRLGFECAQQNFHVLAIKADKLGAQISTPQELQSWLGLSIDPRDAVRALAAHKPVLCLFDQLDAVSELADRHSDRLNLLLNLIQSLAGYSGVHIVATSREFEYRHDARLTSISADRMDLQLPTWEQISPILVQAGHNPGAMAESMRSLLSPPWHLNLFLDVAKPGMEFGSLSSLLDEVWNRRVIDAKGPPARLALIERMAERMSDEETLWLPSAIADDLPAARQVLEANEILVRDPTIAALGFRHQTYYDYTLARAFARGTVSLSDHVLGRQDGLFVRPSLLASLYYLRGTSRAQYHAQLTKLFQSNPRMHIRSLLIELLGQLQDPDDVEAGILLPILDSDTEGPKVLAAVSGSKGWLTRLSQNSGFAKWMQKQPDEAMHCVHLLSMAGEFAPETAFALIESHWLPFEKYDRLSLSVFSYLAKWNARSVALVSTIVRRYDSGNASLIADKIFETAPDLAPKVLRADFDRRMASAKALTAKLEAGLSLTEEEKRRAQYSLGGTRNPLVTLLDKEDDWYNLDMIADAAPQAFLDVIWPWLIDVLTEIADQEHEFVIGYRHDSATSREFDGELPHGQIIKAILTAVATLAQIHPDAFRAFVQGNSSSEFLIVHRLLARGLLHMVEREPQLALEYLLHDPRRLVIGNHWDCHRETNALITALTPHLQADDRAKLEKAVLSFQRYKNNVPEESPQNRLNRVRWSRQHRLRLLRAFPSDLLSPEGQSIREQEERALPGTTDYDSRMYGGWVGPRMTAQEMGKAKDADLLRLFEELSDNTTDGNPKRHHSIEHSRSGGAIQLSQQLRELAKTDPARVARLISEFKPGEQETYAGEALQGLAEAAFPTDQLIRLIEELEQKGFADEYFIEGAATALRNRAVDNQGLPQPILDLLEQWLNKHSAPEGTIDEQADRHRTEKEDGHTILYGQGGHWMLPHGRGPIIDAIAMGYIHREPADYSNWARVIESRLPKEQHPAIWVMTLRHMPILFNGNRAVATQLFDKVIDICPKVLCYDFALHSIAHVIRVCEPKDISQKWINGMEEDSSAFSQQLYGEFLFLYHCCYNDDWSNERVERVLKGDSSVRALAGLTHGAAHLWIQQNCKELATEILCRAATNPDRLANGAVSEFF